MAERQFHRDHHYVPQVYLKRWASSDGRLWAYPILVPHPNVPMWKKASLRGVARHMHLYTQIVAGVESDEFERWLDQKFETPAERALEKATSGKRMTPDDWRCLIRFAAAQYLRTPARFEAYMRRWSKTLPGIMENTLREAVCQFDEAVKTGRPILKATNGSSEGLPMRVFRKLAPPGENMGQIGVEAIVGRDMWLWGIKHVLENTVAHLYKHKWTILQPPEGLSWFTSDNPVVCLNYRSANDYDFGGGWGSEGSEIIFPLGPQHLLYTQIGKRPPSRGERMPAFQAQLLRRIIAEHAYRYIFSESPDDEIIKLRPRTEDADAFKREREYWATWNDDQTEAVRKLLEQEEKS